MTHSHIVCITLIVFLSLEREENNFYIKPDSSHLFVSFQLCTICSVCCILSINTEIDFPDFRLGIIQINSSLPRHSTDKVRALKKLAVAPIPEHLNLLCGCWNDKRDSYTESQIPKRGDLTKPYEFSVRTSALFLGGFYHKGAEE